jgi:hypothetical protein
MQDYEKAVEIIQRHSERAVFVGARSDSLIEAAERKLGIKFRPIYRRFLLEYGAGGLGAFEVYGVINDDFEKSSVPDAIWYTLVEREKAGLPNHLVVIYDVGEGELLCLDCGTRESEESPVIAYQPGYPPEEQNWEIIAKDFGEFFLELVQSQVRLMN